MTTNVVPVSARRIPKDSRLRRAHHLGMQADDAEKLHELAVHNATLAHDERRYRQAERLRRRARRFMRFAFDARSEAMRLLNEDVL